MLYMLWLVLASIALRQTVGFRISHPQFSSLQISALWVFSIFIEKPLQFGTSTGMPMNHSILQLSATEEDQIETRYWRSAVIQVAKHSLGIPRNPSTKTACPIRNDTALVRLSSLISSPLRHQRPELCDSLSARFHRSAKTHFVDHRKRHASRQTWLDSKAAA
jgi:hypothetical protein